ncbi:MAG TPA: disulfide bond formation protein B [Burkholderiaceae bacterium]
MQANRTLYLAIALISFAVIGAALYLQHVEMMAPCPYCVMQRYAFLVLGIFALLGASGNAGLRKAGGVLALLAGLTGAGIAIRHIWIQAHPGLSCGIDPLETSLNKIPTATLLPSVFKADGLCTQVHELFGLSIPTWSLLAFAVLSVALAWLLRKRAR